MYQFCYLEVAMRQYDFILEINDYLATHPKASIVNLGCGLYNMTRFCNKDSYIYNIDFKDVIELRNELLPCGEREENIACNLLDFSWFNRINKTNGVIFIASGVFYYFLKDDVKKLIAEMAKYFKNSRIVFDSANKRAVKLMLKTLIKEAEIKDVNAYFYLSNSNKELGNISDNISVSS